MSRDPRTSHITGIDHVAVVVRDIDASLEELKDRIGLAVFHDEVISSVNVRLAYVQAGKDVLQLVQPLAPGPVADFLRDNGEGLHHVCFAVPDLEAALDQLAPGDSRPVPFDGGRSRRTCFLPFEPSGLRVELAQHVGRMVEPSS